MEYESIFTPIKNENGIIEFSTVKFEVGDEYNVYVVDGTWSNPQHACMDIRHGSKVYSLGFAGELENKLALRSPDPQMPRSTDQTETKKSIKVVESGNLSEDQVIRLNTLIKDFNRGDRLGKTFPIKYYAVHVLGEQYGYLGNNCITILSQIFPDINRYLTCTTRMVTKWAKPTIKAGWKRKAKKTRSKKKKYRYSR